MADFPKQLLASPSGFPDLGPAEAIAQARLLDTIRRHYELAGFSPIETPLVERPEILFAKVEGEIKTEVYGLRLLHAAEGADDTKELALRYDLTVPLARFIATHYREVAFPFRRYAIGPVFRGERAKEGRYRQFIQADIDVIGDGELAQAHDAEIVAVITKLFTELNIGGFTIRINNRKVLAGLIRGAGLSEDGAIAQAMRIIDRLEKVGRAEIIAALIKIGMEDSRAQALVEALTAKRSTAETLAHLAGQELDSGYQEGVAELEEMVRAIRALGVPEERFRLDLSIARGLDYYTGTVYETTLDDHPELGSIASGGRYADLAGSFIDRPLPGVGISIGVSRLLYRLIKLGLIEASASTTTQVLVTTAERSSLDTYLHYAAALREAGIPCEIYLAEKALDKQLSFADRKGFLLAVIAKQENLAAGTLVIRNLKSGEQQEIVASDLVSTIKNLLA
jgi:histidyl-tRNA synthetase